MNKERFDIVVIDDQVSIAEIMLAELKKAFHPNGHVVGLLGGGPLNEHIPAQDAVNRLWNMNRHNWVLAVVLDLNLGKSSYDGFEVVNSLRHCFPGIFVVHSDSWRDPQVKDKAKSLGIRFGMDKLDRDLPPVVKVAEEVGAVRHHLMEMAVGYFTQPVMPYEGPTPVLEFADRLWTTGFQFDGSEESVDWNALKLLQQEIREHFEASQTASKQFHANKAASWEWGTFPSFVTGDPVKLNACLTRIEDKIKDAVEKAAPFINA